MPSADPGGSGSPVRAAAQVFVDDLELLHLAADDRHHLERVLRIRPGEVVVASDGRGRRRPCHLRPGGTLLPAGDVEVVEPPSPAITVAFALTKGERPEIAVQKLTELGVDRIVPFAAERSVARWEGERAARHVERLRRVARQAAMQCRRPTLPEVDEVRDFASVAALPGATLADAGGAGPSLRHPTVLVGPEGGWSDAERSCGLPVTTLAGHVLRAETAAVAAAALLGALRLRLTGGTSPHDPE